MAYSADGYYKVMPSLPGNWKCQRIQHGHFGPFFEWIDFSKAVDTDAECPHCEGYATLEVESATGACRDIDCPWCDGSGNAGDCDDLPEVEIPSGARIWCDAYGNVLDAETELDSGFITFAWLQRYEPARIAA